MQEKITFSFGKNWQIFLKSFSQEKLHNAADSLIKFLRVPDLKGQSFLDIGCGSGLFSYAAFTLGADKVVSIDVDPFSVECCTYLHNKAGSPANWTILAGSILDNTFVAQLPMADIVYSWGVLHHTGNMWQAIKNAANLVNNGGYYYIAIYNKAEGRFGSNFWLKIKKRYNASPPIGKHVLEILYIIASLGNNIIRMRNPIATIKRYTLERGMRWSTDITDWLGGYPYEFATVAEIIAFMKDSFPDFSVINLKETNSIGNNWYLFKRTEG